MPAPKLKGARKATRYRAREAEPEKAFDRSQSRLKGREARMQTYDEVMELGGDEDQFHLNRDKMLLEDLGGNTEGYGDDDSVSDPDEIYSLNLPSHSRTKSPSPPPAEKKPKERKRPDFKRLHKEKEDLTKKGRFGHEYDPMQDVVYPSSDEDEEGEEGASGSEDEEEEDEPAAADQLQSTLSDDASASAASDDDDLDGGDDRWAAAQYHATRKAPGEADSEDEEAAEMELEEARRLQRKARERLEGGDFGVEEDEDEEEDEEAGGAKRGRFEEDGEEEEQKKAKASKEDADSLPPSAAASLSEPEAIAHLLRTSPETLALVDDFVLTASKVKQVEADLEVVRLGDGKGGEHPARAVMELEHQALTTYLPLLAFYFSLLLTPLPSRQASHDQIVESVLERLSSLRQSLATMEELELTSASYGADEGSEDDEEEEREGEEAPTRGGKRNRGMLASEALDFAASLEGSDDDLDEDEEDDDEEGEEITESMLAGLDNDEVEELMASLQPGDGAEELMKLVRGKQREKGIEVWSGSEDGGEHEDEEMGMFDDDEEEMEEEKPKKKAPKPKGIVVPTLGPSTSKPSKSSASSKSTKSSRSSTSAAAADDYLDPLSLSLTDSLDKSTARKSLRFHVSQVAQKAAKREQRTRQGLEGDEDAPRRSKEAARRAVLQRQEHGAGGKKPGESSRLDEGEFDAEDIKAARAVRGEDDGHDDGEGGAGGDDDDYYDLVSAEKAEGRKAKKARYDEGRAAEKAEILSLAESSVDGPRQATRQILANKGLTPKRKKENRNARVKKRLRYDKAQKKLGSMKASYKGGEGKEGYSGESGGITRRNVKSRKLG